MLSSTVGLGLYCNGRATERDTKSTVQQNSNRKHKTKRTEHNSMLDISWGEILVVAGVGVALTGRRDLPKACRFVGSQMGRVVGLLQGARARADQFATNNELRQLQNELRSGLRELDQVKTELAVAASTQGMMGRTLGVTTASANRDSNNRAATAATQATTATTTTASRQALQTNNHLSASSLPPPATSSTSAAAATRIPSTASSSLQATTTTTISSQYILPPAIQTERAVMEDEWEKQGIGFRSRAEQMGTNTNSDTKTGSELLEYLIKQNLIFDQYERVVGEQEAQMQERMESFKKEKGRKGEKSDDSNETKFE
jgi:sec-independent protein translocase protein TatB